MQLPLLLIPFGLIGNQPFSLKYIKFEKVCIVRGYLFELTHSDYHKSFIKWKQIKKGRANRDSNPGQVLGRHLS